MQQSGQGLGGIWGRPSNEKVASGRCISVDKILKYEGHLQRQCLQLLHEIEALQARCRGEATPPARLDISSPPAI